MQRALLGPLMAFLQSVERGAALLQAALYEVPCYCGVRVGFERQPVALRHNWKEPITVADRMEENDFCISFLHRCALPVTKAVLQPVKCV